MQRFFGFSILFTFFVLTPLTSSIFATGGEIAVERDKSEKKEIKLPKDPKAVVVSLDYDGGFASPPLGHPPVVLVRADGRVESGQLFGNKKPEIFKISVKEVKRLLHGIINENKFFEIDADALEKKIKGKMHLADARGAIIIVNTNGKQKKIHFYGLSFMANQIKDNKELQQLAAIEKQLLRLKMVMQVGGKKKVNKWLKLVNKELKKKYPTVKPLEIENLTSAGKNKEGERYCTFTRSCGMVNGRRTNDYTSLTFAKITIPSNKTTKAKFDIQFKHSVICKKLRE